MEAMADMEALVAARRFLAAQLTQQRHLSRSEVVLEGRSAVASRDQLQTHKLDHRASVASENNFRNVSFLF